MKIKVIAKKGCICPSHVRGEVITDAEARDVPNIPFYRGLIRDGSLVRFEAAEEKKPKSKSTKKSEALDDHISA
jgi:hypothetical protein